MKQMQNEWPHSAIEAFERESIILCDGKRGEADEWQESIS
jgi:hypothetical protein